MRPEPVRAHVAENRREIEARGGLCRAIEADRRESLLAEGMDCKLVEER